MDLAIGDELAEVRDLYEDFFSRQSAVDVVRGAEPLGFDPTLWKRFLDSGGPAIAIPEQDGGAGASTLALSLIAVEAGRRLAPVPIPETFAAAALAAEVKANELTAEIASGARMVTLSLRPPIDGILRLVPAGAVADVAIGLRGEELVAWRRPESMTMSQASNFAALPLADWDTSLMEARVLGSGTEARVAYARAVKAWRLFTSAMLNGARRTALEIGVDYVKTRDAFGVTIGWFQAIQHRLADLAVAGDGAELLLQEAAWAWDAGKPNAGDLVEMSFAYNAETAFRTCRESLQFHGGYGFTLEYDIQLFYRRTKAWPLVDGDPRRSYVRVAEALYPPASDTQEK
jgi:alkylation response protein AidB-like acyl-CoA dehydrogenase